MERTWYFEEKDRDEVGCSKGYVRYGTVGFESTFVDNETKKTIVVKRPMSKKYRCFMSSGVQQMDQLDSWHSNLFREDHAFIS